jgi:hypothetical protein
MMALSSTPANVPAKKSIKKPGTHPYRLTQKELPEDVAFIQHHSSTQTSNTSVP